MSDDWYKDPQYVPTVITHLSEAESVYYLREAWKIIYNVYPANSSIALLYAQWALESGLGVYQRNFNYGNIKKVHENVKLKIKDDGQLFTMFRLNEVLNGKLEWFDPPHIQTHMRCYKTAMDGAIDYIKFLSQRKRYIKAWQEVINGNAVNFVHQLRSAGYFTASEALYMKGVTHLTDQFNKKSTQLLSWYPTLPIPQTTPISDIFTEEERKEIMQGVIVGIDTNIHDYFTTPRLDIDDGDKYFTVEKKSIWQSLKEKIGIK
jgi:hypothetical protein